MFARLSPFVRPALVNGAAGVIVAPGGRPVSVIGFTVRNGKIVEIDGIADRDRLRRLDLRWSTSTSDHRPYERLSSDPAEETKLRVVEAQLAAEAQKLSTRGIPQLDDAAMTKLKDIFEVEDRKRRSRRRAPR